MSYKSTAIKAAKQAGKVLMKYFGKKLNKRFKTSHSVVTNADIESTKIIRKIITKVYPQHSILDEELKPIKHPSDYTWIIDPLDGTHNFTMNNPLFGISIALKYKDNIILGVVYFPALKRLYYAEKGKGAYKNNKPIRISPECNMRNCLFIFDAKLRGKTKTKLKMLRNLADSTWRVRIYGVATYHNMEVVEGNAAFNIDFDSYSWDYSASLLIIEEAGGIVTDLQGNPWTPQTHTYLASNGKIHNKVLNVIKK